MHKIEIQGGIVRLVSTVIEREMLLEDFKSNLYETRPFSTPRLPVKCAFVIGATNGIERVAYVVERPPQTAHMELVAKDDPWNPEDEPSINIDYDTEEYDVAVPWQYWVVITEHNPKGMNRPGRIPTWPVHGIMYVWSQNQIESIEDESIHRAYVPNTNGATHFCMGRTDYDTETLDGMIDAIVDTWWTVPFNTDLGRNVPPGFNSINDWAESKRAPRPDGYERIYSLRTLVEEAIGVPMMAEPPGLAPNRAGKFGIASESAFMHWLTNIDPVWTTKIKAYVDSAYEQYMVTVADERAKREEEDRLAREHHQAVLAEMRRRDHIRREQERAAINPPTEDPALADLT